MVQLTPEQATRISGALDDMAGALTEFQRAIHRLAGELHELNHDITADRPKPTPPRSGPLSSGLTHNRNPGY